MTQEQLIKKIENFKEKNGGTYSEYYIGITNDPQRRLNECTSIIEHIQNGIYTEGQPCIKEKCDSRKVAINTEQYFQEKGMLKLNKSAHGVEATRYIYCFKMTSQNLQVLNEARKNKNSSYKIVDYKTFVLRRKQSLMIKRINYI